MKVNWRSVLISTLVSVPLMVYAPSHLIGDEDPFSGGEDPFGDISTESRSDSPFDDPPSGVASDPFDDATDPFGNEADPFANHADPFGNPTDPFGDEADPVAGEADPFGDHVEAEDIFHSTPEPVNQQAAALQRQHELRLRKLGVYSIDPVSMKKRMMLQQLGESTEIAFDGETLEEVAQHLTLRHEFPILFDRAALADQSIDPTTDTVTSVELQDIALRTALELILNGMQLTFEVRDEYVWVTTTTAAERHMVTRVYRRAKNWRATEQQVATAIQATVLPGSWGEQGGPGSISVVEGGLVIANSYGAHDAIDKLFAKLDCLYSAKTR